MEVVDNFNESLIVEVVEDSFEGLGMEEVDDFYESVAVEVVEDSFEGLEIEEKEYSIINLNKLPEDPLINLNKFLKKDNGTHFFISQVIHNSLFTIRA
uniref:Uncharacterized protein n=1 Tax=Glycine max TaxID=3847 RepID=A0A0R0EJ18_SOYBN